MDKFRDPVEISAELIRSRLMEYQPCDVKIPRGAFRPAGVLVPLWFDAEGRAEVIFIRRSQGLKHHAGQIAFPGGGKDPTDPDLKVTAVREAVEELGIKADDIEIIGRLEQTFTPSGYRLQPFVGILACDNFCPSVGEVETVYKIPLVAFFEPSVYREELMDWKGERYLVPFFEIGDLTIWGATGRILVRFLDCCFGKQGKKG